MFKKILIGTDFSAPSRAALSAAIELAQKAGSIIEVIHVVPEMEGRLYRAMKRYSERRMVKFFRTNLYRPCKTNILFGDSVTKTIYAYAKRHSFDLIVLGSHGKTNLKSLLIGSVTQQTARISDIPLLVVGPKRRRRKAKQKVPRIALPTDFFPASSKAIDFGIRFGKFLGAQLHFIHVESRNLGERVLIRQKTKYPWKQMTPGKNQTSVTRILFGDPPEEIAKYARRNDVDYIVMATHGTKGLQRILLGSVTASVLSRSSVPVITISSSPRGK
jgi:nucleotide-binding universal stress UspA family protein